MNYISLSKGRSFIMIAIHSTVSNALFDTNTPQIVIIINFINKVFIFNKSTCLGWIYKCIDISYIIIDIVKAFITFAITSITGFKLFVTI